MVAQPLMQLFQPLLLRSMSPVVSCGKGEASCSGPEIPCRQTPGNGAEPSPVQGNVGLSQLALPRILGGRWEVLPCIQALARLCMAGAACPGWCPHAPMLRDPAVVHWEKLPPAELCFLSYERQKVFQEGGRQVWGAASLLRLTHPSLAPRLNCLDSIFQVLAQCPESSWKQCQALMARLKSAQKVCTLCSANNRGNHPAALGKCHFNLLRCKFPSIPRG